MKIDFYTNRAFSLLALAGLMLSGCGGSSSGLSLVPVEGVITLDGQPVSDAEVQFRPAGGRPSVGRTNADGRYSLAYTREEPGALPGEHVVSISTLIEADEDAVDPVKQKGRKETIPRKYNTKSTLKASVTSGQTTVADFALTSKK